MSDWKRVALDDLMCLQRGFDLPTPKRHDGCVPVVGAAGVSGSHNVAAVQGPGVVVGRAGASMGKATYVAEDFWPLNTSLFVTDFRGNVPRFVYYRLSLIDFSGYNSGAAQPMLNRNYIKQIEIILPSRPEQEAIAELLGALDDKIATNERIALTADGLLRAQYRELSLTSPMTSIETFGAHVREHVSPEKTLGTEPYIGLEHIPRRSMWLDDWGTADEVSSTKSAFRAGDILFGKLRPYFHKVAIAQIEGICSTDIIVARAETPELRPWLLMVMSSDEIIAFATARSDGTRMPRTMWSDLTSFSAPWPGREVAVEFGRSVAPLIERVQSGLAENRALATLRDTLLPKLVSGELKVRQAEKLVEDAT